VGIFHGLVEVGLCGDEFFFHWEELLILCNEFIDFVTLIFSGIFFNYIG